MPTATQLHPLFAVRISGIDIGRRLSMEDAAWVRCMISADPARVDPALVTEAERAVHSSVRRAIMAAESPYGSALYLGAHAHSMNGFKKAEGRTWIKRLMDFASSLDFVYGHRWRQGDGVGWDNRAVTHRAISFVSTTKRWYMVRTTTSCSPATH